MKKRSHRNQIVLGYRDNGVASFDLPTLLRTRLLVQANSGGGKSYLLRRLAEQLFGRVPIIIIDPEGEFPSLREKYGFVHVGKGGDAAADPRTAAITATRLLELRASAVVDIFELQPDARHDYVARFLAAMIDAPKKLWQPLVVMVDEAHVYAPEKGFGESEALGPMVDLCSRGRKRGYCAVFATQRLGKLRKDAAAELNNVLIGRTYIDIDVARAADALGVSRRGGEFEEFAKSIRVRKDGEFWAFGAAISTERVLVKVGDVATSHPKMGKRVRRNYLPPTPSSVKKLLPRLEDLPKEQDEVETTERALRAKIRLLTAEKLEAQAELRARPKVEVAAPAKLKIVEKRVAAPRLLKRLEKLAARAERAAQKADPIACEIGDAAATLKKAVVEARAALNDLRPDRTTIVPTFEQFTKNTIKQIAKNIDVPYEKLIADVRDVSGKVVARREGTDKLPPSDTLPRGERAVLAAMAQFPAGVTPSQLSLFVGLRQSSRNAYVARLRAKGLVERGALVATPAGLAALGDYEPLPTGDALREHWLRELPEGEAKILAAVSTKWPQPMYPDELETEVGYKRSSRNAYVARLAARQLVTRTVNGGVRAADDLFDPTGLRARAARA